MSNHSNFSGKYALAPRDGPYNIMEPSEMFKRNPGLYFWNKSKLMRADRLRLAFQPEIGSVSTPTFESLRRFLSPAALEAFPRPGKSVHPLWEYHKCE